MSVKPIPDGYSTVTPYLIVKDAAKAIAFYTKAFGATELFRMADPSGRICHAEIQLGTSRLMLADEFPQYGARSPESFGGSPVGLAVYVEDVDALASQAVAAGAKVERPVQDQFYGDRSGTFVDPFGHKWTLSTHKEDVAPDEMNRRFEEAMKKMGAA
jgi:PhnB protein